MAKERICAACGLPMSQCTGEMPQPGIPITRARRIIVTDADGTQAAPAVIDLTNVLNANTRALLRLRVQVKCNMGHWHDETNYTLEPWG